LTRERRRVIIEAVKKYPRKYPRQKGEDDRYGNSKKDKGTGAHPSGRGRKKTGTCHRNVADRARFRRRLNHEIGREPPDGGASDPHGIPIP